MNENSIRTITTVAIIVIVFAALFTILKWLVALLLPLAILVIAAYIIYRLFNRRTY